jgi:hypothetical protein
VHGTVRFVRYGRTRQKIAIEPLKVDVTSESSTN